MFNSNTDKEWEKYGRNDPYFGIITHEKFHKYNLTDESKEKFFESGFTYINDVLNKIRQHINERFTIKNALDFGCGVGRLVIPLANEAQEVTGVDVSDSMLNEAKKNCEARAVKNVIFKKSDDNLSSLHKMYNFIHSFIVFQHIPVARGEKLFKNLIEHLEPNGVCVVHFTYKQAADPRKFIPFARRYIPLSVNFINLVKGRGFFAPCMQMHTYDLNRLFLVIQKTNILNCYMEFTDHGGHLGIVVYFKQSKVV